MHESTNWVIKQPFQSSIVFLLWDTQTRVCGDGSSDGTVKCQYHQVSREMTFSRRVSFKKSTRSGKKRIKNPLGAHLWCQTCLIAMEALIQHWNPTIIKLHLITQEDLDKIKASFSLGLSDDIFKHLHGKLHVSGFSSVRMNCAHSRWFHQEDGETFNPNFHFPSVIGQLNVLIIQENPRRLSQFSFVSQLTKWIHFPVDLSVRGKSETLHQYAMPLLCRVWQ